MGYRSTNVQLLSQPENPKVIGEGTKEAIEEALKHLPKGKVIEADVTTDGFDITVGVESSGRVYEVVLNKDLHTVLKEERPEKSPHWVERDVKRAKRNV